MTEVLPAFGDLRNQLEQTYYQGHTNHCGAVSSSPTGAGGAGGNGVLIVRGII